MNPAEAEGVAEYIGTHLEAAYYTCRDNPVRVYSIVVAALALVAFYVASLPVPLILGVVVAILGGGQAVRAQVSPMSKVVEHVDDWPAPVAPSTDVAA